MDETRLRDGAGDAAPARRQAGDRGDIHDPPVLSGRALDDPLDLGAIIRVGLNGDAAGPSTNHSCVKASGAPVDCRDTSTN
jgi:hypothetical protein